MLHQVVPEPSHYSPSAINSFRTCPRKWMYHKLEYERLPEDKKYALIGSVVHSSIQDYYRRISEPVSRQSITSLFTDTLDALWDSANIKRMDQRRDKIAKCFIEFEIERLSTFKQFIPSLVERRLTTDVYGPRMVTIVDAYWEADKLCINWKTSNSTELSTGMLIQGKFESMVLEANRFPVERYYFLMLYTGVRLELPKVTRSVIDVEIDKIRGCCEQQYFPMNEGGLCDWYCEDNLRCRCERDGKTLWSL